MTLANERENVWLSWNTVALLGCNYTVTVLADPVYVYAFFVNISVIQF